MNTSHRTNTYNHEGKLKGTLIVTEDIGIIEECRLLLTKIELELLEPIPNKVSVNTWCSEVTYKLATNFW